MTNREFLTAIANGTMNDEIMDYAKAHIEKLDAANEKRRNTPSKKAVENQPLVDQIVNEILNDEAQTASDVAAILGVSTKKASALLRAAVVAGNAVSTEVKIPKKGVQKAYTRA